MSVVVSACQYDPNFVIEYPSPTVTLLLVVVVVVEEKAVFIRGVNTNEDSPDAQHAPGVEEETRWRDAGCGGTSHDLRQIIESCHGSNCPERWEIRTTLSTKMT